MAVRKLKPMTPGQRGKVVSSFETITTDKPEKSLLAPIKKSGGRNNSGKMTMRYRGGGHKRRYRVVDFKRDKHGMDATVQTVEYDPNRNARIALVEYTDGEKRYIIAPTGIEVGQTIRSGEGAAPEIGNALYLKDIPLGTIVHNIELRPNQGAKMARSAGTYAQLAPVEAIRIEHGATRSRR
jgi:large subunit ribosomal protein L2